MNKYYYDNNEYSSDEEINNDIENVNKNNYYINNENIYKNVNNYNNSKYDENLINAPQKKFNKNIINDKDNKIEPKILFPDDKVGNDKVGDDETEINKFIGLYEDDAKFIQIKCKNDWKYCEYCEKKHGKDYFIKNISYCVLCWSWLNANDINLETGEYTGENNFDDIKAIILKTYKMYNNIKDKNPSSIYNKINILNEAGILHTSFRKLLGFEQEKKIKKEYLIYNKSRKLNINYEKSILEI